MRRRRDADHHPQALKGVLSALLAVALAAAAGSAVRADVQKISAAGTLHRVETDHTIGRSTGGSSALRHLEQTLSGEPTLRTVTGTDDGAWNRDPALEIDPVTDQPVLVWSRVSAGTSDIFISRFDGSDWSLARAVVAENADDVQPEIRITRDRIHLMWRRLGPGVNDSLLRINLDRQTLDKVYGPETLPLGQTDLVPPSGEDPGGGSTPPSPGQTFFAAGVDPDSPGAPPRVFVWGVRDEPMPVGYSQGFVLPTELQAVSSAAGGWIGGRFVVWFVTNGEFYYTFRDDGRWSDLRHIRLTADTPLAEALREVAQMLERLGPDLHD